jgi:hypothetical protein
MKTFHAAEVDVSEDGDYFQVSASERRGDEEGGQYFLVQRQFETEDRGLCYVEDDSLNMVGHCRITKAELGRDHLFIETSRPRRSLRVSFTVSTREFARLERVIKIIVPGVKIIPERQDDVRPGVPADGGQDHGRRG